MAKLSAEAKVGLLVIVGSIALLFMTFIVGKYQFGETRGYTLSALFDSVAGLDEKSAVRMAGVKIGTVERVELSDSRAKIIMRVNPEIQIKRGSEATIKTMGLLGEKFVEIVPPERRSDLSEHALPGTEGKPAYLQPEETIQATVSPSDVDKLINQLSGIAGDIKQVTGSLRQVLGTEAGARNMEDILHDLRSTMANIKEFSVTLQGDGSELVKRLNELAGSLDAVVSENRDNLKVSMENIREASRNAELALASIDSIVRKVDRGEGTLGKLLSDDSMYNSINGAAKGISDYTSRVDRLQTIVGFRTEYMFPKSKSYFSLELKPRPDKYYIFEMANDPFGKYTRTVINATPGSTLTTETYEDRFKFSLMFAKRWGDAVLRVGLIESTGGIGGDYFLFGDKMKVSVDAWNFNSKEPQNTNTHLKGTVNYMLGNTLFVNGGVDNVLNSKRSAPFVGIGLRFNDEDLKYLIGSVPIPK
jgi:phospholipid/cholesterol/gamma-HCH transport system substrate-binding protein